MRRTCIVLCLVLFSLSLPQRAVHADQTADATAEQTEFFENDVLPVLKENCLKCHSGEFPKAGLNLTTREGILEGGESGPAVDMDDPEESYLISAVKYEGWQMPPTGQMSEAQTGAIVRWVREGLPWPKDLHEIEFEAEPGPPPVNEETKSFWSFQPVTKPTVPSVPEGAVVHNEIDAFIVARLHEQGLTASEPASAQELIRRAHYGVTGLPPSAETVQRFSADPTREAWKQTVNELLESPHYGEHWGRHWLDLVRYAETNSYERDSAKPFIWRYRDYVIQSLNDDKPYDQFITEQIAGDELDQPTPDSIIATGFYRLGRWDDEPSDPELAFYDDLDDIVTTTGQTFLGLTINCARCHDHKIDPIPQRDYYRMIAFFRNVRRYGVRSGESVLEASVTEIDRPENKDLYKEEIARYENDIRDAQRQLGEIEDLVRDDFADVERQEFQFQMNRVPLIEKRLGTLLTRPQVNRYRRQTKRLLDLKANKPKGLAQAMCVKEDVSELRPTHVLGRGNPHAPGDVVAPGFPSVLSPPEANVPTSLPEGALSSGRRRVLAEWIASPENPLTARVIVNRIWQYHFGRGLVRTSSDFGFQGSAPTHPELLDWLASRLIEENWSLKAMHRLIMNSATYRMSSRPRDEAYAKDPNNDLFWRFDMRRLSAEEIRDSILWANGSLNADKMFGPSIYTDIPDEVKAGQSRPGAGWGTSSAEDKVRRSIYIHVKRSLIDPLLESFDVADTDQTCPVRFVTTQPTQALGMMNSDFIQEQAQIFADYLKQSGGPELKEQVSLALSRVTQRPATEAEVEQGLALIASLQKDNGMSEDQARVYFCLLALNLNELIYLD
jgi:mono/diheme cytochrome c family protein